MHEVFSILGVDRIFWRVGMKPGAAVLAGRYGKTLILALSGNQYASYVDLHMIVRPVLSEFTGNNRLEMIRGAAALIDRKGRNRILSFHGIWLKGSNPQPSHPQF